MARLHTRRHGKSKSTKPIESELKAVDDGKLEEKIVGYAKSGMKSTLIGQNLKDKDGVGYVRPILGKRLTAFLNEKGFKKDIPTDLMDLMTRAVRMRKHLGTNHRDVHGRTRLQRVESKIWRLGKYYKSAKKLPANWKYDPEQAALIIKET
jgi:small subunit ribosomal protein S15